MKINVEKWSNNRIRKYIEKRKKENHYNVLDFRSQTLKDLDLSNLYLANSDFVNSYLINVDFSNSNLMGSNFLISRLENVKMDNADLTCVNFQCSQLKNVSFKKAGVFTCVFTLGNFSHVNFSYSTVGDSTFDSIEMEDVIFKKTEFSNNSIINCNLSECKYLNTIKHYNRTNIGSESLISIYEVNKKKSIELETFCIAAGVPKDLLNVLSKLYLKNVYSCFICYGEPDRTFAEELVEKLRENGISSWLYSLDSTVGEKTWHEIGIKRREFDKMIVLCSSNSLIREGVLKEIEEQIDENPDKIMPLSLDNLWKEKGFKIIRGDRDLKPFLIDKNYADFSNKNYNISFKKLLKGLYIK